MGLRNRFLYQHHSGFFITTTCLHWLPLIKESNGYRYIEEAFDFLSSKYQSVVLAYVIMPNHLHFILYFKRENKCSAYMRDLKKYTSVKIREELEGLNKKELLDSMRSGKGYKVWMDRFDDVYIRDRSHLEVKLEYIHSNPLQSHWSLVKRPEDYLYSSAKFYHTGSCSRIQLSHYLDYF